jgi:hypothetical protein
MFMKLRRIVIISDYQDGALGDDDIPSVNAYRHQWLGGSRGCFPKPVSDLGAVTVDGGYLERFCRLL